jgi:hypothetical protein
MNAILKKEERQLCESSFMKWTIDKPDLHPEDLDLYINLVLSMLDTRRMRQELGVMIEIKDDELETSRASGKANVSGNIIDALNELRKEISQREVKQEQTINRLTGERKERLKNGAGTNYNITNIIEIFREKDKRDKILKLAEERKKKLGEEVDKLSSMDAIKFEAFGFNKSEIIG